MVTKTIWKKKTNGTVKKELLNSLRENNIVEQPGLNIDNVTDPREAISIINSYEEIKKLRTGKLWNMFHNRNRC